jgi:hypothetical protein
MIKKKGVKIEDFLNNNAALPDEYKELLCGVKPPVSERDLVLRLLSITAYQSIKIKDLEREITRVKNHLANQITNKNEKIMTTLYQNGDVGIEIADVKVRLNRENQEGLLAQFRQFKPIMWKLINENPYITKAITKRPRLSEKGKV